MSHTLNLRIDEFGHVLQSVAVGYPRFLPFGDENMALQAQAVNLIREVQNELHIAYTETRYTDKDVDEPDSYRVRLPCEIQTYELTGIRTKDTSDSATPDLRDDRYFSIDELRTYRLSERYQDSGTAVGLLQYHEQPDRIYDPPPAQKRLVEHVRTLYVDDASGTVAPTKPLALGKHGPRGLKPSGIAAFAPDHFFLPERYTDPFGNVTKISFDSRDLYVESTKDARGNETRVIEFISAFWRRARCRMQTET